MNKTFCDFCNQVIKTKAKCRGKKYEIKEFVENKRDGPEWIQIKYYDMCKNCFEEFVNLKEEQQQETRWET